MISKKKYIILKPIDSWKLGTEYNYTELKIEVETIYLFKIIPIFKKSETVSATKKSTYGKPKTIKLK